MPSVLNMNMASMVAQRNLGNAQAGLTTSVERLSSGLRINRSKDDAAGLAISETFVAQIRSIKVAARNANDAISTVQAAEGALVQVSSMLQRMKELSTQGNNGAYGANEKGFLMQEVSLLRDEINKVADRTTFNGVQLVGPSSASMQFQVGASAGDTLAITAFRNIAVTTANTSANMSTTAATSIFNTLALKVDAAVTGLAPSNFGDLSIALDAAINEISSRRANFGATQSRLDHNISNLQAQSENMDAARSRIQDTDYAAETASLTRGQILQQAATAMLSQANQMPNIILSLLK